jgi:hypothetical protein
VFRVDHPSVAVWTAWSHHGEHGDMAWFHHHHDNVAVKNPDREIRRKMWRLAERLGAKVQGDDGEYYDRFGNPTDDASKTRTYWPLSFATSALRSSGATRWAEISRRRHSRDFRFTILSSRDRRARRLMAP